MIAPYRREDASLFDVVRFKAWHAGEFRQDLDEYTDATDRFEPRWRHRERKRNKELLEEDELSFSGWPAVAWKFAGWALSMLVLIAFAYVVKTALPRATITINGESAVLPPHSGMWGAAIGLVVLGTFVLTFAPDAWAVLKQRGWDLRLLATVALIVALILVVASALPPGWRHPTWVLVVIGVILGLAQIARGVARRWRS